MENSRIFKLVTEHLEGDTAVKTAVFIKKRAKQAITLAISQLENDKLSLQLLKENCENVVDKALINNGNGKTFDAKEYLGTIISAHNELMDIEVLLEKNGSEIAFWNKKLAMFLPTEELVGMPE